MSPHARHRSRIATLVTVLITAFLGLAGAAPAYAADSPVFFVDPVADAVWGHGWSIDTDVSVTLGGKKGTVIGTARTDYTGAFRTDLTADVRAGSVVAVSCGTTLTHTVTTLRVRSVDTAADTVTGTALRGTEVEIGIVGGATATTTTTKTGAWTATGIGDLTYGLRGYAAQYDPMVAAATWVGWETHNPVFRVEPAAGGYWVWGVSVGDRLSVGYQWPASTELTAVVQASDGAVLATETMTTDENGEFDNFPGTPIGGRSSPGDVVTVTDGTVTEDGSVVGGTVTKTTTVTALTLDTPINTVTDVVTGGAEPGSTVYVQPTLYDDPVGRYVTAGVDGTWTADFSQVSPSGEPAFDIAPMSMGYAAQQDPEGDATHIGWHADVPNITVRPDTDEVTGFHWGDSTPETEPWVTVSVRVAEDPDGRVWSAVASTTEASFRLDLAPYDLAPGDHVIATNGTFDTAGTPVGASAVKEIVVSDLTLNVDHDANTVSGTAWTDGAVPAELGVSASGPDGFANRGAVPAAKPPKTVLGTWAVDFGTEVVDEWGEVLPAFDLREFTSIEASVRDYDWDSTAVGPSFTTLFVDPEARSVRGTGWRLPVMGEGTAVDVLVDEVPVGSAPLDPWGSFQLEVPDGILVAGRTVSASDDLTTKDHVVTDLSVSDVDLATDTVTGTAGGGPVYVAVWNEDGTRTTAWAEVGTGTPWTASFAGQLDLVDSTTGYALETDADGDGTWVTWSPAPEPPPENTFAVDPAADAVWGFGWTPGATVRIYVDDDPDPVLTEVLSDSGDFWLGPDVFSFAAGQVVRVTDGALEKVHTVTSLAVTAVDPDTDTVAGMGEPTLPLVVGVTVTEGSVEAPPEWTDTTWTADFTDIHAIVAGTEGYAGQTDPDGDATWVGWTAPMP